MPPRSADAPDTGPAEASIHLLHAAIHVRDLVAGQLDADHWLIDLPGVFLPALLMAVLCLPRFWTVESGRRAA